MFDEQFFHFFKTLTVLFFENSNLSILNLLGTINMFSIKIFLNVVGDCKTWRNVRLAIIVFYRSQSNASNGCSMFLLLSMIGFRVEQKFNCAINSNEGFGRDMTNMIFLPIHWQRFFLLRFLRYRYIPFPNVVLRSKKF